MPEVKFKEITSYNVLNNLQVCKYACVLKQKIWQCDRSMLLTSSCKVLVRCFCETTYT